MLRREKEYNRRLHSHMVLCRLLLYMEVILLHNIFSIFTDFRKGSDFFSLFMMFCLFQSKNYSESDKTLRQRHKQSPKEELFIG